MNLLNICIYIYFLFYFIFLSKFNSKQYISNWISFNPTQHNTWGLIYYRCVHMFANLHWPTHNVWVTQAKVAKRCHLSLSVAFHQPSQTAGHPRSSCVGNTSGQRLSLWARMRGSETVCGGTAIPTHRGSDSSATQGGALCTPGCFTH